MTPAYQPVETAASYIETATPWVVLLAWPGAVLIPVLYLFAPWYRSHLGRALMLSSTGLAGLVTVAASRIVLAFGDDPPPGPPPTGMSVAYDALRLSVYLLVVVGIYYELVVMTWLRSQGTDLHADHDDTTSA